MLVMSMSDTEGYLVVEHNGVTLKVPFKHTKLKVRFEEETFKSNGCSRKEGVLGISMSEMKGHIEMEHNRITLKVPYKHTEKMGVSCRNK